MGRAAEAYIWIAHQVAECLVDKLDQRKLFHTASDVSPFCYEMLPGLVIERHGSKADPSYQYVAITTKAIKSEQVVSKELAVVPWCSKNLESEKEIKAFLEKATKDDIATINGIYPRSREAIPWNIKSLSSLEDTIRSLQPGASVSDAQEKCRALACAKVCAFDNGIHHFGSFYNHSCEPNCEVRSKHNLEVVANRDIAVNEELCISYRDSIILDLHVVFRQATLEKGWGQKCFCPRCRREFKRLENEDPGVLEAKYGRGAVEPFVAALEQTANAFSYPPNLPTKLNAHFNNWQTMPWKKACVLNHEFQLLFGEVHRMLLQSVGNMSNPALLALNLRSGLQAVEERGAILCLSLLIETKTSTCQSHHPCGIRPTNSWRNLSTCFCPRIL